MELEALKTFRLCCSQIPAPFLADKQLAIQYFRNFGRIKKIIFKRKSNSCLVEYYDNECFQQALQHAGDYNGQHFVVSIDKSASFAKPKRRAKEPDPDWLDDPEVRAELDIMGGPSDVRKKYNLRPEKMVVDSPEQANSKSPQHKPKRPWKNPADLKKPKDTKVSLTKTPEYEDLLRILRQQASTVEEKYRILDARDKLIRLRLKNDPKPRSSTIVGTCPDMCPEKERLMRETQHQIALYELDESNRINPNLAVKQYSRSSADQETPLPHDLRPVSVLQMTMGYLMHEIMDLCDSPSVNLAEWYHFLWDRTRGIRKDITQQELCNQGSVELVEQCARFHIHCSARLVSEDPSVFDHRINTENLTKCLQTLKYLYNDLRLKGESCVNEAEFRAYVILLNLNDGNFMWEVQQLKNEIQKSAEVKFALDVHSALDKNNYVKFFKLVQSTSYLNACILMRYFVQVRYSALQILVKCYAHHSARAAKPYYPLSELTRILAFEDEESSGEFVMAHGLIMDEQRTHTLLDRNMFTTPEFPIVLDRAIKIVESKRVVSVGQVVCGKALPLKHYENHKAKNSFDDKGFLKKQEFTSQEDQDFEEELEEKKVVPTSIFAIAAASIKQEQKTIKPIDEVDKNIFLPSKIEQPITTNIFGALPLNTPTFPVVPTQSPPDLLLTSKPTPKNFFTTTPKPSLLGSFSFKPPQEPPQPKLAPPLPPIKSQQQIEEEQRLEQQQKELQELEVQRQAILKEIEEEKLKEQALERQKAEEAQRAEQERLLQLKLQQEKEQQEKAEISRTVRDLLTELVTKTHEQIRLERLDEIKTRSHLRLLNDVITKWRSIVIKNKRKRKALDCSPTWLEPKTLKQEAEDLKTPNQTLTLRFMKRYKRGHAYDLPTYLDEPIVEKIHVHDLVFAILTNKLYALEGKLCKNIFWKVTISLPDSKEMSEGLTLLTETVQNFIKWEERSSGETLLVERMTVNPAQSATYCLSKSHRNSKLHDSNGLIFIGKTCSDLLISRIKAALRQFGTKVRVPVVLVLISNEGVEALESLRDQSDLVVLNYFNPSQLNSSIQEGLIFLAQKVEKVPPLNLNSLENFLWKNLATDIWKRASSFTKWNSEYKICMRSPSLVIKLYNEAVVRLKKIAFDANNLEYAIFPEIFKQFLPSEIPDYLPCNYRYFPNFVLEGSYTIRLEKFFDKLFLPNWTEGWPPANEVILHENLAEYLKKASFPESSQKTVYYKMISLLLKDQEEYLYDFQDIQTVLWTNLIEVLAKERISSLDFSFSKTPYDNKSIFNQFVVVYNTESLKNYSETDWFYLNNPIISDKINKILREEPKEPTIKLQPSQPNLDLDKTLQEVTSQLQNKQNINKLQKELEEFKLLLDDLDNCMKIEKKISSMFEETLKNILTE